MEKYAVYSGGIEISIIQNPRGDLFLSKSSQFYIVLAPPLIFSEGKWFSFRNEFLKVNLKVETSEW